MCLQPRTGLESSRPASPGTARSNLDRIPPCGHGTVGINAGGGRELRARELDSCYQHSTRCSTAMAPQMRKGFLKNWFAIEVRVCDAQKQGYII